MNTADAGRRYLVHVGLQGLATPDRVREFGTALTAILKSISGGEMHLAYRSAAYDVGGYIIRTRLYARQISEAIQSPGKADYKAPLSVSGPVFGSPLQSGDALMVIDLGADGSLTNMGRLAAWMQHH